MKILKHNRKMSRPCGQCLDLERFKAGHTGSVCRAFDVNYARRFRAYINEKDMTVHCDSFN